jgi:hypothetical protein
MYNCKPRPPIFKIEYLIYKKILCYALIAPWYWLWLPVGATGVWHWIVVVDTFKTVHGCPAMLTTNG